MNKPYYAYTFADIVGYADNCFSCWFDGDRIRFTDFFADGKEPTVIIRNPRIINVLRGMVTAKWKNNCDYIVSVPVLISNLAPYIRQEKINKLIK